MNRFLRFRGVTSGLVILLLPVLALACLWDSDTLRMERSRFPSTLELITGKFLRHSPEFYQWRIDNRLYRLKVDPDNLQLLDDLAVAYDKVGQHDQAIATAERMEKLRPGRYETAANLGTFYFHAGKFKEGLPHIDRALKINPAAHFGREKYQKLLVEYLLQQQKEQPGKLPLTNYQLNNSPSSGSPSAIDSPPGLDSWVDFLRNQQANKNQPLETGPAIQGILGMMKFGKYDSPVLLEALGFLLAPDIEAPGKFLAARAFLKASYEVPSGPGREAYRGLAAHVLTMKVYPDDSRTKIPLEVVEQDFLKELQDARSWYLKLREKELNWIKNGRDPEQEFDQLYDKEPEVIAEEDPVARITPTRRAQLLTIGLVLFSTTVLAWLLAKWLLYCLQRRR